MLSRGGQCNHKGPYNQKRAVEKEKKQRDDSLKKTQPNIAGFEGGHEPSNADGV